MGPPSRPLSALGGMSKVGQKLLEGWTMLSQSCPVCLQPLLRRPSDQTMWCVECNAHAVNEADFDASKHRNVQKDPLPSSPPPLVAQHAKPVQEKKPASRDANWEQACENMKQTLARRLDAMSASLEAVDASQTAVANVLMEHVREICKTMKELKN